MQIREIKKSLYNSVEILSLGNSLVDIINSSDLKAHPVISTFIKPIVQALNVLEKVRDSIDDSEFTDKVEEADLARDFAFRAFWTMVEAGTMRRNDAYRSAAELVMERMSEFDKGLYDLSYDHQTAELKRFMRTMEESYTQSAIGVMGMSEWYDELKQSQQKFEEIQLLYLNDTESNSFIPTKEAREHTVTQVRILTQSLNGLFASDPEGLEEVVSKVDKVLATYEQTAKDRKNRESLLI